MADNNTQVKKDGNVVTSPSQGKYVEAQATNLPPPQMPNKKGK